MGLYNFTFSHFLFTFSSCTVLFLSVSCKDTRDVKKRDLSADYASFDYFEYVGQDPVFDSVVDSKNLYINPIITGFHPDPSICRVGEIFYLVNSSFCYFPGLPIFKSTDLINWQQIGHVIDRKEQADFANKRLSAGMYAPTIRYNNGIFYVICTNVEGYGNFIVTAKNPEGPWSNPILLPEVDGIDPDLFFDEDGKVYITHNGPPPNNISKHDGHRAIYMMQYDVKKQKVISDVKLVIDGGTSMAEKPVWIEGPHLIKKEGFYFLICAQGGTSIDHSEVVFRSKNIYGPYASYDKNPILTQKHLPETRNNPISSTGHADFVQTQNGDWWAVFLGCRPYEKDLYNTGRETFLLPVSWHNEWPAIIGGNEGIAVQHKTPGLKNHFNNSSPTTGNFSDRDNFDQKQLRLEWNFVRAPLNTWHKLEEGKLKINPRKENIKAETNFSFIGRRQQHAYFLAETEVVYSPKDRKATAGLVAFQNEKHYLLLGVRNNAKDQLEIYLEKSQVGEPESAIMATNQILNKDSAVQLKIQGSGRYYDFYWKLSGETKWKALAKDVDASILSTEKAGGFVGTYLGMYASSEHFSTK